MRKMVGISAFLLLTGSLTSLGASALKFGQVDYAAHGHYSFAVTSVVLEGDKIAIAYIDEFQILPNDGSTGVPNSEYLSKNFTNQNTQLASKRVNNEYYSAMMKKNANATVKIADNYDAIQKFVTGKTVAELEATIAGKKSEEVVDAVAGATLADTKGYIESIIAAAKAAK